MTDTAIRIGVAYPDTAALRAVDANFDVGDIEGHFRAVIETWQRSGALPLHGRKVELSFRKYSVLSAEEQRSACIGLVQDEKVFAVLAMGYFDVGAECVAREYRRPFLSTESSIEEVMARGAPYLFGLGASGSRVLRNLAHWADRRGVLAGKRIGIYYEDNTVERQVVRTTLRRELERLGHRVEAEAASGDRLGGPADAIAVQRFADAKVDVAILLTSKSGFMQQANAQGYRPTYLESDWDAGTADVTAGRYPPDQFDKTFAMTGTTRGTGSAGGRYPAGTDACVTAYEKFSGRTISRPQRNGREPTEWGSLLSICDLGNVLMRALRFAGPELTTTGLVEGLESVRGVPLLRYPQLSFGPGRHSGVDQQRTVQWSRDCTCWRAQGAFAPLLVP